MGIKKIVITGDVLRVNARGMYCQAVNIRWLYYLLRPIFRMLCSDIDIRMLAGEHGGEKIPEKFYLAAGLAPSEQAWAAIFGARANPRQLALVEAQFSQSLVIAFELPEILAHALAKLNIPFIDFSIHPIRFMPDLAFGVRTNISGIKKLLEPWQLTRILHE